MRVVKILVVLITGLFLLCACSKNDIVGTYVGESGKLKLSNENQWSYYEDGNWGSKDIDLKGTYSKSEDNTYKLECDEITLYATIEENGLYVYSDDSDWNSETMKKIDSDNMEIE
ncbi:MAG: hypothetical protein HFJ40_01435 [Clostridia bacterium]|nr:hypothetical protein [Clostridia bacterium]